MLKSEISRFKSLLEEIRSCTHCEPSLLLGPNPVLNADVESKIAIIGQAPGIKVHHSGVPWKDASGNQLRKWLGVSEDDFYDPKKFAIIPMGFCYPGKGKSGDLPPRPECAPMWHDRLIPKLQSIKLKLLIGQYAQNYYLKGIMKKNLTDNVKCFQEFLPEYLPLPHPSPRNRFWMTKNPWFHSEVIPALQDLVVRHIF
jgi:uracil-DNA glycosylase